MNDETAITIFGQELQVSEFWLMSAVIIAAILFSAYQLWSSLSRGRVSFKGRAYARAEDGFSYKLYTSLYAFLLVITLVGGIGWLMDYAVRFW